MRAVTFTAVHVAKSKEIMASLGKYPKCYYILFLFLFGSKKLRKTGKTLLISQINMRENSQPIVAVHSETGEHQLPGKI